MNVPNRNNFFSCVRQHPPSFYNSHIPSWVSANPLMVLAPTLERLRIIYFYISLWFICLRSSLIRSHQKLKGNNKFSHMTLHWIQFVTIQTWREKLFPNTRTDPCLTVTKNFFSSFFFFYMCYEVNLDICTSHHMTGRNKTYATCQKWAKIH